MPHIKNTLFRHRIIDKCLRNPYKPFPSKQELRVACEEGLFGSEDGSNICDSTIEKDLFAMRQEYDAPIKYSKLNKGYYYEDPEFTINDVPLNESDLDAVRFAANTLLQFKDVELFREFGNAIDKIVDRVALSTQAKQQPELNEFVQFETAVSIGGGEFLPDLLSAIQKSVAVYFDYENFNSKTVKPRKVCPLLLKEYRNRWYLISYDLVKDRITTYALERMRKLELSEEKVVKPHTFNPTDFFRYSVGISTSESAPEIVEFTASEIASKYLETQPLHHSQQVVKSTQKGTVFQLEVFVSEELIRSILSFGGEITVHQPPSLAEEIKTRLGEMVRNYGMKQ
ncbi:MAG: WYL domain-containing protein [Crocinitomicaceae bacterium]|nr:WYL domain-containing protein [Crocinitomicaceae bacterium]NGF74695.1 WYL domain-containing protein [Fluviicola sp. SGL-29]